MSQLPAFNQTKLEPWGPQIWCDQSAPTGFAIDPLRAVDGLAVGTVQPVSMRDLASMLCRVGGLWTVDLCEIYLLFVRCDLFGRVVALEAQPSRAALYDLR